MGLNVPPLAFDQVSVVEQFEKFLFETELCEGVHHNISGFPTVSSNKNGFFRIGTLVVETFEQLGSFYFYYVFI